MNLILVACFMVSVAALCGWHGHLQHLDRQQLAETQLLFLAKLDARDKAAEVARDKVAAQYETFIDKQTDAEQAVANADDTWLKSEESAVEPDPDLDWESEHA